MPGTDGISIIVPTNGRVLLVQALLESIAADVPSCPFPVQAILADSSDPVEKHALSHIALEYGAVVVDAPRNNPGAARNVGFQAARFRVLLFVDSDVTLAPGTLRAHWDMIDAGFDACAGIVEFTGKSTFAWRAVAAMQVMLPFRYPHVARTVPWAPTANISFTRDCFTGVQGFDPALPPYGGEDVDLGFRCTDAGYRIRTSSQAIAVHTTETWAKWGQNIRRLISYGKADFHLIERHPERTYSDLPSPLFALLVQLALALIAAPVMRLYCLVPLGAGAATLLVVYSLLRHKQGESFWVNLAGPLILALLDLGKWSEAIKRVKFRPLFLRLRYLDDIIERDWEEIRATTWGVYASMILFVLAVLVVFLIERVL